MSTTLSPVPGSPASIKNELSTAPDAKPVVKKNKVRKRVNSAEKRSQHNAIERARRETLNGKFISLARLLPALAESRRPSKSAIVNNSITHLTYQRDQRLLAAKLLRQVTAQHDALLKELNEWRVRSGVAPKASSAWTTEMDDVCAVESEAFGTFEGADAAGDDDEDDVTGSFEPSMAASLSSLMGSNDLDVSANGLFIPSQAAPAAVNGLNWSRDFAFSSMSSNSSLPFNAFMSDNLDNSSSGSPTNSIQGNVLTPPTTADVNLFGSTHTPSPRSSTGFEERVNSGWNEQQLLFLQPQAMHSGSARPNLSAMQSMPNIPTNQFNMNGGNAFNNLFAQHAQNHVPQAHTLMAAASASNVDPLTQSLLAQMFPSQNVPVEEISQWRKMALSGAGMNGANMPTVRPSVLRTNSIWDQPLEGY